MQYPIRIIGEASGQFKTDVSHLLSMHVEGFDPASLASRPSKTGKYLSLATTLRLTSAEQVNALYAALAACPGIKTVL